VGCQGVTGVVVDELEDHALAPTGKHVLGGVELPAGVRCGVHEPPPCRAWLLPRLEPSHACLSEDPGQRRDRGHRRQAHRPHLVVHADRPMVKTRRLQRSTNIESLGLDLVGEPARTRPRSSAAGLKGRGRAVGAGPGAYRVEGLAGDLMLGAERCHCSPRRVIGPLDDRETDTRIDRFLSGRHRQRQPEVSPPRTPVCHRRPDTELSPMSWEITVDCRCRRLESNA